MLTRLRSVVILTKDIEKTAQLYQDLYDFHPLPIQEIKEFGWLHTVCPMQNTVVELLQPASPDSRAAAIAEGWGEGVYCIEFETDDFDADVAHLKEKGARIIRETGQGAFRTAWVHPKSLLGIYGQVIQPREPGTWPVPRSGWEAYRQPSGIIKDIRQLIVLVKDRPASTQLLNSYFGLNSVDTSVHSDLLVDFVPLGPGNSFLAIAEPQQPDGPGARYLARRGEGPYVVAYEVFDLDKLLDRVKALGIDPFRASERPESRTTWLHPKTAGNVYTMLAQITGENPWPSAGKGWYKQLQS